MRRSILKAGVWTAFGLAIAVAIVGANVNARHAATAAKAANEVVATPASSDECTPSDVCCIKQTKVDPAAGAAAPRVKKAPVEGIGSAGMVIAIDPETGELGMPNADQARELRGTTTHSTAPAAVIRSANGGLATGVELEPEYATIHIDAKGNKIFGHSDNPNLNGTPPAAKPVLEDK